MADPAQNGLCRAVRWKSLPRCQDVCRSPLPDRDNPLLTDEEPGRTLVRVSVAPHPDEPTGLTVLDPEEALKRARPLPSDEEMAIEGLTDDEWKAFENALAER